MLISSLPVAPCSDPHSWPVAGCQSIPCGCRWPHDQTGDPYGLSLGVVPSSLRRRILPESEDSVCDKAGLDASPVVTYSLPSGPKRTRAPSCVWAAEMLSTRTAASPRVLLV